MTEAVQLPNVIASRVTLDFETFYSKDFNLDKYTTEEYVRSKQFQVIGVGVKVGAHPIVWLEEWDFREWAKRVNWDVVALLAHHTHFDGFILSHHYGIRPGFLLCTMSMARAIHGSGGASLEFLGPKYGAGEKGKELAGVKGLRREQITQAHWAAFGEYCKTDVRITDAVYVAMRPKFPKSELLLIDTTIRMFTEPIFRGDEVVLHRTLAEERRRKSALFRSIAVRAGVPIGGEAPAIELAARKVLGSGDKFAKVLEGFGVTPPKKYNDKGALIWAFAKDDPGMQTLLEHPREEIRALAEARIEVKSNIVESRTERVIGSSERGAIPFYLKYCGAHTHRWSGGDKMNPQNFNRGGALRDAILAPPGCVLVVADSGQIEARVLAWFAGEAALLDTFRRNDALGKKGDFYSDEGSRFFLKPISKEKTPIERQLSKNMILGLGFGMGWAKFATELLKGMLGSEPVQFTLREVASFNVDVEAFEARKVGFSNETCGERVEAIRQFGLRLTYRELLIHCAVADHFVRLYRTTNRRIAGVWKACDEMLRAMETPGGDPEATRMTFGPLKVKYHAIEKPNGMVLHYPGLRRGKNGFTYKGGKSGREFSKIYGGLLTENIVQSLARDIVAEQVLFIRRRYENVLPGRRSPIGTTTHDEAVSVVPAARGAECFDYMIERMKIPPAWCIDLPLNASGGFGTSYGAVK